MADTTQFRNYTTRYDPGMGLDLICDALNLGLYIGVDAASDASPTISSAIIKFIQSGSGSPVATNIQDYLRLNKIVHGWIPTSLWAGIADGTGTTDLSSYISAAINAVIANPGGDLYFPQGRYYVSSTITIDSCGQLTLRGAGGKLSSKSSVGQDMRGSIILNKVAGVLFKVQDTQTTSGGRRTENILFDGIGVEQFDSTNDVAFQFGPTTTSGAAYPNHVRFNNGGIYGGKYGVDFTGNGTPFDIRWDHWDFDGMGSGVYFPDSTSMPNQNFLMMQWHDCRMNTCTRYAVEALGGYSFKFSDCRIEGNTLGGLYLSDVTSIVLDRNHFEQNSPTGAEFDVYVLGSTGKTLTCTGNTYTRQSATSQATQFKVTECLSMVFTNEQFTISGGTSSLDINTSGGRHANINGGVFDTAFSVAGATYTYLPRGSGFYPGNSNVSGNFLDWYEEGTWTPAVNFGGATTGITYSWDVGAFQRVGNVVHAWCGIALSSKGSATGAATIAGLPYASVSSLAADAAGVCRYVNFPVAVKEVLYASVVSNTATLAVYKAGDVAQTQMQDTDFNGNSQLYFEVTYRVA